jgi:hypothetical protein
MPLIAEPRDIERRGRSANLFVDQNPSRPPRRSCRTSRRSRASAGNTATWSRSSAFAPPEPHGTDEGDDEDEEHPEPGDLGYRRAGSVPAGFWVYAEPDLYVWRELTPR